MSNIIDGIIISDLKQIYHPDGSIKHGIKNSDDGFNEFGEAYFSFVNKNSIKAWKMHNKMTMNLLVPYGEIFFCFYDERLKSPSYKNLFQIIISKSNYKRITVPPKIWFGFKGISTEPNIICNISNIQHDPNEVSRKEINEINFNW